MLIRSRITIRPHRLKKTSSLQSKRRDLHHTWDKRKDFAFTCYSPRWITTTLFTRFQLIFFPNSFFSRLKRIVQTLLNCKCRRWGLVDFIENLKKKKEKKKKRNWHQRIRAAIRDASYLFRVIHFYAIIIDHISPPKCMIRVIRGINKGNTL